MVLVSVLGPPGNRMKGRRLEHGKSTYHACLAVLVGPAPAFVPTTSSGQQWSSTSSTLFACCQRMDHLMASAAISEGSHKGTYPGLSEFWLQQYCRVLVQNQMRFFFCCLKYRAACQWKFDCKPGLPFFRMLGRRGHGEEPSCGK